MSKLFCYNHSPEPALMKPDDPLSSEAATFFTCPVCDYRVKLVLEEAEISEENPDEPSYDITEEEARIFLEEYARRYQLADINLFMQLWFDYATQSVISEPGRVARVDTTLEAIRRSYAAAFRRMGRNTYRFQLNSIYPEDNNLRVNGSYHIEYPTNTDNPNLYEGQLSILLSRNFRGGLQILHLSYQPTYFT